MTKTTLPDRVNLAQIARTAWTGRAAVAAWRRRNPDFPVPVGGTSDSPLFERAAVEEWLHSHRRFPHHVTPTPAERAEARLTALQLTRAITPGLLSGESFVDTYDVEPASVEARGTLAVLREHAAAADLLTDVAPLTLECGYLAASALAMIHRYYRGRIEEWIAAAAETIVDVGTSTDISAVHVLEIAVEALWIPDRDALYEEHAARAARVLWQSAGCTHETEARTRHELIVSACWLAASVLAPALGGAARADAHLEALARHIIESRGENPT